MQCPSPRELDLELARTLGLVNRGHNITISKGGLDQLLRLIVDTLLLICWNASKSQLCIADGPTCPSCHTAHPGHILAGSIRLSKQNKYSTLHGEALLASPAGELRMNISMAGKILRLPSDDIDFSLWLR